MGAATAMRTGIRPAALALAAACLATAAPAADTHRYDLYARPQRLVRLADGRRINLLCMGSGAPTVLLEAGWADSNVVWRLVQPALARTARTCAYDRAGLGFSDRAPGPRDAEHITGDLEALVRAAGLRPPYVLVGHSLGGLTVRLFADRHQDDVAGMVLVDPTVEHQDRRFGALLPRTGGAARAAGRLSLSRQAGAPRPRDAPPLSPSVETVIARSRASTDFQTTSLAELAAISGADSDQIAASRRSYGAMPLIVLTGSENVGDTSYTPVQAAVFKRLWNTMHDEVAGLSSRGVHRQAPGASHMIVYDDPEAITQAVRDVIRHAEQRP